jgi:uncharacterized protein (TIGR03083 family)
MTCEDHVSDEHLEALRTSARHLQGLTGQMTAAQLTADAYPSEWRIADVLSHLGSAAVIMQRRFEDGLAGGSTPDDYAPGVWQTWNAKSPLVQRDDALEADAALLARLADLSQDERDRFALALGPLTLSFAEFLAMRLNEHALHTWDIEVVGDPSAVLPREVAGLVVDNLQLVARYTAKPTGDTTSIAVATSQPSRGFVVELAPDSVVLRPTAPPATADLELPAEAFARLVYGRLDPQHTPSGVDDAAVDTLRRVFPGP